MARTAGGVIPWIDLDPDRNVPLHRQLYAGLRSAILSGRISPGARLPSTRSLALDLDVSRATVVTAFGQLRAEGYVEGRVGAGTYVTPSLPEEMLRAAGRSSSGGGPEDGSAPARLSGRGRVLADAGLGAVAAEPVRPFVPGVPAADAFPFGTWRQLVSKHLRRVSSEWYASPDPMGWRPLREAVAAHLAASRGVRCEARQVVITSGAQTALARLARLLVDPGDAAWIEDPGYLGARRALAGADCRQIPVPIDESGLDIAAGMRLEPSARLAYITPSHQFPLGVTMPLRRRLELLEWADDAGAWILEDDYDSEYRFEGRPLQALQGLDRAGRVIYVGTFSKIIFPALRLGYVVLPDSLVDPFVAAGAIDAGPPPGPGQAAMADFIGEGHLARHIRRMRTLYAERRETLVDTLREKCGDRVEVLGGNAGMHLTVRLPPGTDDRAVARVADARGVSALPLSLSSQGTPPMPGLVLGFAGYRPERLRSAVIQLALAMFTDLAAR